MADYLMIGGFLGAGKTTAMLRLAGHLAAQGRRVGLITNDQSHGLVDTVLVASHGFAVEEITGGCFCCRFDSLTQAADSLTRRVSPDVILAEPVGSCTDLRATVQYPLRRIYGAGVRVGPLSVLVDPLRALRVMGLEAGSPFSEKVLYVYRKQLEEADIILINKCDILAPDRVDRLQHALEEEYRGSQVLRVSAREGSGLDRWFAALDAETGSQPPPEVDYDVYAEGEALLGWLNANVHVTARQPFDGNRLLMELAQGIRESLSTRAIEIAHLKMTLTPDGEAAPGTLNLVATAERPESPQPLLQPLSSGRLLINLRAEGAPESLRDVVESSLAASAAVVRADARTIELDHFRPARPTPTHRMSAA
jgi:G3E family GTPase